MILGCNGRIGKSLTIELFKQNHELILVDKVISKELQNELKKNNKQNFSLEKIDLNTEKNIQILLRKVKKKLKLWMLLLIVFIQLINIGENTI